MEAFYSKTGGKQIYDEFVFVKLRALIKWPLNSLITTANLTPVNFKVQRPDRLVGLHIQAMQSMQRNS